MNVICLNRITVVISLLIFIQINIKAQIYINELMAKNDHVITDNTGEFEDWIEMFNAGGSSINLASYIITDGNIEWIIPDSDPILTTIPAGGFLIFWADNDPEQGANHIDFKLSASGESIALFDPNGTLVDEVSFGVQNSDLSFGRTTDGAATFQIFVNATPGASNNASGTPTYPATITAIITSASDDAEDPVGNSNTDISGTHLQIVNDWSGDQTIGLRFSDITIPNGSVVDQATIQFTSVTGGFSIGFCDLNISGHYIGNTPTFEEVPNNITSRVVTSTAVNWQPPEWLMGGEQSEKQRTPNLKSVVQEIIDHPEWEQNNALAFIINGTGVRGAHAFETLGGTPAQLILEVKMSAPTEEVSNLYINEIGPGGTDYSDEEDNPDDWVELYNSGSTPINIGGLYLTDDFNNLTKWQIATPEIIPPNGFTIIWPDKDIHQGKLHANFNLEASGEQLALVQILDNEIIIIDSLTFPQVPFKATYGRITDGVNNWTIFGQITLDASNNGAGEYLEPPVLSLANGIYSGAQTLEINHVDADVVIRYTTDGSEPTASSIIYNTPLTINTNQSIKAKAFKNNTTPSVSAIRSYLIDINTNLKALYINTDPANFFDDSLGIYIQGTNGIPGFCNLDPFNWNQDWERPINLSLFDTDGAELFSVNAGVKIGGACSRTYAQKSLNIYLRRNTYGDRAIDYQLYDGRTTTGYERLKLRNSGQDFLRLMFRDGLVQTLLWDKIDMDLQGYLPTVLYLNGEYWGIHNIREIYTDEYFNRIYGINKDEIDVIKNPALPWVDIKKGDDLAYMDLFNFIDNNDLNDPVNYDFVENQIDINEFINYWTYSIYIAKYDWPANNTLVWKERKAGAKWRWAAIDHDQSTGNGLALETEPDYNTLEAVTDSESQVWPNHRNSTLFLRKLLDNTDFRNEYIQRTCSFIALIYGQDRVTHFTDSILNIIQPEIQNHIDRWEGACCGNNIFGWQSWVDKFRDFYTERPNHMRNFLQQKFNLSGTYELTLNYDQNTGGTVVVNANKMETPFMFTNLYFQNIPLRVTAVAKPGFTFSYWLETGETTSAFDFISNTNAVLTPIFFPSVNLGEDFTICAEESTNLDAIIENCSGCSYLWSNGQTESSINVAPMADAVYSVTVTYPGGGFSADEIMVIVDPLPQIDYESTPPSGGNNGMIEIQPSGGTSPYSVTWQDGNDQLIRTNLPEGIYNVTITDANGCSSTITIELLMVNHHNPEIATTFEIYPNPNNGQFVVNLVLKEASESTLQIYNVLGQTVYQQKLTGLNFEIPIHLKKLTKGVYLISVTTEQGMAIKKIIVQ